MDRDSSCSVSLPELLEYMYAREEAEANTFEDATKREMNATLARFEFQIECLRSYYASNHTISSHTELDKVLELLHQSCTPPNGTSTAQPTTSTPEASPTTKCSFVDDKWGILQAMDTDSSCSVSLSELLAFVRLEKDIKIAALRNTTQVFIASTVASYDLPPECVQRINSSDIFKQTVSTHHDLESLLAALRQYCGV
ncbi:hypothetical protein AeNC1_008620 [Aphanomyces euteiches]|nr:hypothetical protein AeNC1_008620 [Aphanomyces euteiches]